MVKLLDVKNRFGDIELAVSRSAAVALHLSRLGSAGTLERFLDTMVQWDTSSHSTVLQPFAQTIPLVDATSPAQPIVPVCDEDPLSELAEVAVLVHTRSRARGWV